MAGAKKAAGLYRHLLPDCQVFGIAAKTGIKTKDTLKQWTNHRLRPTSSAKMRPQSSG
jgi:hypothetical protein